MRFPTAAAWTALVLALGLLAVPGAAAQVTASSALERAADALRSDTVYVDPQAERTISAPQAESLRRRIREAGAGPVRIAILPAEAADAAGGDPDQALRELALAVGEPGTYGAVIGSSFSAGATAGVLPRGEAGRLAAQALDGRRAQGTSAVLSDFVGRVAQARRTGASEGTGDGGRDGGGGGGGLLLALLAIGGGLFGLSRLRRRRREREELEQVREFARDDLVALGDDIRALDIDVEMPGVDPAARHDYGRAVECYQGADEALRAARRAEDIERVTSLLEEGRYAMTAAQARLERRPLPERRPPCFFDPRHGPSTTDVEWAPPDGAPRAVPVCAADAQRIADGLEPEARHVTVGGQSMPYWNAGPMFMPWAGGFFGGGLLPGLFIGSMLGGGLGLFGGAAAADAFDAGGAGDAGGDFGGAGDFGGDFGGGDFGGGDFGGGDFGGGDF
jgi:hypothetical protein